MKLLIGCTGWSYEGWSGTFYPKSLKNSEWLKYYSSIFDFTEINSTYYQIPNQFLTKKWFSSTPESFRFSAKFPGKITHEHKLKNVKSLVLEFLSSLVPLKSQIISLVLQLPPSLSFDDARPHLDELFSYLPEYYKFPIEGRHESWFTDDAIDYLTGKNLSLVWNDIPGIPNPAILTSDFLYVRLIGDRSISEFGKVVKDKSQAIKNWADKIILSRSDGWLDHEKKVEIASELIDLPRYQKVLIESLITYEPEDFPPDFLADSIIDDEVDELKEKAKQGHSLRLESSFVDFDKESGDPKLGKWLPKEEVEMFLQILDSGLKKISIDYIR